MQRHTYGPQNVGVGLEQGLAKCHAESSTAKFLWTCVRPKVLREREVLRGLARRIALAVREDLPNARPKKYAKLCPHHIMQASLQWLSQI